MYLMQKCFAVLCLMACITVFSACTHLEKPDEIVSYPNQMKDWGKLAPEASDRARHKIEGEKPFEWWYFDGHLTNGQVFVGVFQSPSFMTGNIEAMFTLYTNDWTREDHIVTLDPQKTYVSHDDVHLETPAGYVRRVDDQTYKVRWEIDDIEAEFTLKTLAPGWIPFSEQGEVNKPERDFFWAVHQGRNEIQGTITRNGITEQVSGVGYADHNWGRKPLNEITRKWIWGRIIAGEYTIVYADVDYVDPDLVLNPLYIAKGDTIIVGSGSPAIRQWEFDTHPVLKRHYPQKVFIEFEDDRVRAEVSIVKKQLVEEVNLLEIAGFNPVSRFLIQSFVARPTYFRVIADFEGEITIDGKKDEVSGECLYEVMGFE